MRSTMILTLLLLGAVLTAAVLWWTMPAVDVALEARSDSEVSLHESDSVRPRRVSIADQPADAVDEDSQIAAPDRNARISLRARDEDAQPIGNLPWTAEARGRKGDERDFFSASGVSDNDGNILLNLDGGRVELAFDWVIRLRFARPDHAYKASFSVASPRAGRHDLGELEFAKKPLVLAGRIIDPEGRVVADGGVTITFPPPEGIISSIDFTCSVFADDDGRFAFYDDLLDDPDLTVEGFARGYMSEPLRVKQGDRSVLIRAFPKARLEARFVASGRGRLEGLSLSLQQEDGRFSYYPDMPADGRVGFYLRPGTYSLEVSLGDGFLHHFLRRSGLKLESGRTLDLGDVVLDHDFRAVEIELDFGGETPPQTVEIKQVVLPWGGTRGLYRGAIDADDPRVTVDLSKLPARIVVRAKGFRTERFELREEKVKLRVRRPHPVRMIVQGAGPVPEGLELRVRLAEPRDVSFEGIVASGRLDPVTGAALLGAPHPGRFVPSIGVWRVGQADEERREFLFSSTGQEIEVLDVEESQEFVLPVPAEFLGRLAEAVLGDEQRAGSSGR